MQQSPFACKSVSQHTMTNESQSVLKQTDTAAGSQGRSLLKGSARKPRSPSCGALRRVPMPQRPRQNTDPLMQTQGTVENLEDPPVFCIGLNKFEGISNDRMLVEDESQVPPDSTVTGYYYTAYEIDPESGEPKVLSTSRADTKMQFTQSPFTGGLVQSTEWEQTAEDKILTWGFQPVM
eukprot:Blabericola_migrator_1__11404@NODE_676_length_6914_cov_416_476705_g490_i0_p4_GENE_NODE_676_length_6914_cov_416_476705_g490_i0NODE_676_length_6914_cov_416_476705_g490_i0_p4_ORF_typecomplete_len179_score27_44_NODE_676_length_6914_cov_416_476705_g490_i05941130